jgi:hypothetical protein
MVKKANIMKEAKEVMAFVQKNKKLPKYVTIENKEYGTATYAYLLCEQILNLKTEAISPINVKLPTNSNGDVMNEKVLKNDYLDMAKRIAKYIKQNKQAPSYAQTVNSKKKAPYHLYVFCFSKVLAYYNDNKQLPNYCVFNSKDVTASQKQTTTTKKTTQTKTTVKIDPTIFVSFPHFVDEGCNRLGQCTAYYCGVHATHQVLKKFGFTKYTEAQLAKYAGTTTKGTDHNGIAVAIAKGSNNKLKIKWMYFSDLGKDTASRFKKLGELISVNTGKNKADAIIHSYYRNKYGHYETIWKIDTKNKIVYVLNSLGDKCNNSSYCGYIEKRTFAEFASYINNTPGGQPSLGLVTYK